MNKIISLIIIILIILHSFECTILLSSMDSINPYILGSSENYDKIKTEEKYPSRTRRSGISDQRLAELVTLVALQRHRMKNKHPVGFGEYDLEKIGKRMDEDELKTFRYKRFYFKQMYD